MKDLITFVVPVTLAATLIVMFTIIGVKEGKIGAYNNCIEFNKTMTVEAARDLCKKTVYGRVNEN